MLLHRNHPAKQNTTLPLLSPFPPPSLSFRETNSKVTKERQVPGVLNIVPRHYSGVSRKTEVFVFSITYRKQSRARTECSNCARSFYGSRAGLSVEGVGTIVGLAGTGSNNAISGFGSPPAAVLSRFAFQLFTKAGRSASVKTFCCRRRAKSVCTARSN